MARSREVIIVSEQGAAGVVAAVVKCIESGAISHALRCPSFMHATGRCNCGASDLLREVEQFETRQL